jgi:signal transduction histidine kinase
MTTAWKVLVVDDNPDVLLSTRYVLEDVTVLGAGLEIVTALSAEEAESILEVNRDFAILLIDVVLEKANAGLTLVNRVRTRYGMSQARIILRTGQPGDSFQRDAVNGHDINDYIEKQSSTNWRIITAVITAVRAYDQLCRSFRLKSALAKVLGCSNSLMRAEEIVPFAQTTVSGCEGIFGGGVSAAFAFAGKAGDFGSVPLTILAGTGNCSEMVEKFGEVMPMGAWSNPTKQAIQKALDSKASCSSTNSKVFYIMESQGREIALFISQTQAFNKTDDEILDYFINTIRVCFDRLSMLRERMSEVTLAMGTMAHEFRTPIASLKMANEFIQVSVESGRIDTKNILSMLKNSLTILDRMTMHINQSVENVRIVMKERLVLPIAKLNVTEIVRNVLRLHESAFASAGLIEVNLQDNVFAWLDRPSLEQSLINLMNNARQALHARKDRDTGPQIIVSLTRVADIVSLVVEDRGIGIPQTSLKRIFDPFFASNTTPSHGLGLTMVRKTTQAMGGDVKCQSTEGYGTKFTIELKAADDDEQ